MIAERLPRLHTEEGGLQPQFDWAIWSFRLRLKRWAIQVHGVGAVGDIHCRYSHYKRVSQFVKG
jgi:hypothetical protein